MFYQGGVRRSISPADYVIDGSVKDFHIVIL